MALSDSINDPRRRTFETKDSSIVAICFPESRLVSNMLSKFSFVNEEILRSQVINELRNFTNRDKVMDPRLLNTLTNFTGYYPIAQGFNQSIMHPSQLSISPSKHHNRSQQSFDDDFGGTQDNDTRRKGIGQPAVSKPVDALQML